jgi:hypothetical protein
MGAGRFSLAMGATSQTPATAIWRGEPSMMLLNAVLKAPSDSSRSLAQFNHAGSRTGPEHPTNGARVKDSNPRVEPVI